MTKYVTETKKSFNTFKVVVGIVDILLAIFIILILSIPLNTDKDVLFVISLMALFLNSIAIFIDWERT